MLSELKTFESHEYVVKEDQIGYKEQDDIVFDISYGYQTLFAYYAEHERGKISKVSLNNNISILIRLGSFSFAEIPLNRFSFILGVTGTLQTLSVKEKHIIENDYGIKLKTLIPSVYGTNKLKFDEKDDLKVENEENYFKVLKQEIKYRIVGKDSTERAVFVFFGSKKELNEFYNHEEYSSLVSETTILTEESSVQEKKHIINNAIQSGKITFFTKVFGRGTDFITHDEIVRTKGGVHVIQSFLSEELSEETQIKGRTARQGEDGSFSLIVLNKSLEKYQVFPSDISQNSSKLYEYLNNKRNVYFVDLYEENIKYVDKIKQKHNLSIKFIESLIRKNTNAIKDFLLMENKGFESISSSKTLILMDATGSMSGLLEKTKRTLETMFERTFAILKDNAISENSFQIKIAVYRNYSSPKDKILQNSSWENKSENLLQFLKTIHVEGGWGNEAIEIALWQANQEKDLSQVILIGDAAANTKDEVDFKRKNGGHNWDNTEFKHQTYYENELDKLIAKDIKVHAFYVAKAAEQNFQEIARKASGSSEFLDLNSNNSSGTLIDLVTKQVLNNIGGKKLVDAYRNKYNSF